MPLRLPTSLIHARRCSVQKAVQKRGAKTGYRVGSKGDLLGGLILALGRGWLILWSRSALAQRVCGRSLLLGRRDWLLRLWLRLQLLRWCVVLHGSIIALLNSKRLLLLGLGKGLLSLRLWLAVKLLRLAHKLLLRLPDKLLLLLWLVVELLWLAERLLWLRLAVVHLLVLHAWLVAAW